MKLRSFSPLALALPVLTAALAAPFAAGAGRAQDDVAAQDTYLPPEVGDVAPPLGTVTWYTLEEEGVWPDLASMRGEVVVVHSWGYYCDSCVRVGVPMVVDLTKASRERGLYAVSLTCQIMDGQPDDHFVGIGLEMGIEHPMALASSFGEYSPYLNLNHQKSLTWCTVIGRHGAVVWKGDPSSHGEDFLAAVQNALNERETLDLGAPFAEPVREAVAELVAGDYAKARDVARKLAASFGRKKGEEAAAVAADAARLVALIDAHGTALEERMDGALASGEAEAFVRSCASLQARFPKSAAAKRAKDARKGLKADPALLAQVEGWEAWIELEADRPALFPVRADKETKRYTKALASYLKKNPEGPGAETAAAWLNAFEG